VVLNWYYYNAFVGVITSEQNLPVKPWKLYERTQSFTVDDGCLAGAALGLAASIPTLFMQRPAIPRWTRCLGLVNIGACAGILGAHGYLQYNGERKKAYQRLDRRLQRKSMEFWGIYWDKELMARFNPVVQLYIRHNAVWHASHLPVNAYELPMEDDSTMIKSLESTTAAKTTGPTEQPQQDLAYYTPSSDYAEYMKHIDVESYRAEMQELEAEKETLRKEAEYILILNAQRKYRYIHTKIMDTDERELRLRELHLCEIAYNRLSSSANAIDTKLTKMRLSLQHKALVDTYPTTSYTPLESWLPQSPTTDPKTHNPTLSIQEMESLHRRIAAEVRQFEEWIKIPGISELQKERWKRDLEDGRVLMRAADCVLCELERVREGFERDGEKEKKVDGETQVGGGGGEKRDDEQGEGGLEAGKE
jgi:hypothetical protein